MRLRLTAVFLTVLLAVLTASCSFAREETTAAPASTSVPTVRVTFPEGSTAVQIARLLEQNGVCSAKDFLAAANTVPADFPLAAQIANAAERPFLLEGYIFPDTYDFYVGESAASALSRFLANTKRKLTAAVASRAGELGYSVDEILIIASIIQEESGFPEQDPLVSSVLHNRLNSKSFPMLQFNVTFEYIDKYVAPYVDGGSEKYRGLYNTYRRKGLPAGPISNPGMSAINAALYPADTGYYYFVTDKNMNYYYASTYSEHLANCRKAGVPTG
ncbi:MAG TPA: endolytic transglycosylase MltG [Clostridiales bacterium]|jgi:UPF0755 protein|nr:MAG: putative aminodeoxychorismate lyase [Firmicutes bacterium ADurb.Bin262]HOU09991.1 endolytic transglycosylase MltG [Clostridiales bacterium]HQK72439.1 endolytic transglycosylase MltG [Clostridiales bacterium]